MQVLCAPSAVLRMYATMIISVIPFLLGYATYASSTVMVGSAQLGTLVTYLLLGMPLAVFITHSIVSALHQLYLSLTGASTKEKALAEKNSTLHAIHRRVHLVSDTKMTDKEKEEEQRAMDAATASINKRLEDELEDIPVVALDNDEYSRKQQQLRKSSRAAVALAKEASQSSALEEAFQEALETVSGKGSSRSRASISISAAGEEDVVRKEAHRGALELLGQFMHTAETDLGLSSLKAVGFTEDTDGERSGKTGASGRSRSDSRSSRHGSRSTSRSKASRRKSGASTRERRASWRRHEEADPFTDDDLDEGCVIYSDSPALVMRMTKSSRSRRGGPVALALARSRAAGARAEAEEVASTSRQKQRETSTTTTTMIICMLVAKGGNLEAGGGSRLGLLVAAT